MPYPTDHITCVILAGGRGSRMRNADKGLLTLNERPLVAHAIDAVKPQAAQVLISANRSAERYRRFGYPVLADELPDYQGPLAGILTALSAAQTPLLLTVPCDSPWLCADLGPRLYRALRDADAELAVADDGKRIHPVVSLMRVAVRDSLAQFLASGQRKIDIWYRELNVCHADFRDAKDCFANLNTPEELAAAQKTKS